MARGALWWQQWRLLGLHRRARGHCKIAPPARPRRPGYSETLQRAPPGPRAWTRGSWRASRKWSGPGPYSPCCSTAFVGTMRPLRAAPMKVSVFEGDAYGATNSVCRARVRTHPGPSFRLERKRKREGKKQVYLLQHTDSPRFPRAAVYSNQAPADNTHFPIDDPATAPCTTHIAHIPAAARATKTRPEKRAARPSELKWEEAMGS